MNEVVYDLLVLSVIGVLSGSVTSAPLNTQGKEVSTTTTLASPAGGLSKVDTAVSYFVSEWQSCAVKLFD